MQSGRQTRRTTNTRTAANISTNSSSSKREYQQQTIRESIAESSGSSEEHSSSSSSGIWTAEHSQATGVSLLTIAEEEGPSGANQARSRSRSRSTPTSKRDVAGTKEGGKKLTRKEQEELEERRAIQRAQAKKRLSNVHLFILSRLPSGQAKEKFLNELIDFQNEPPPAGKSGDKRRESLAPVPPKEVHWQLQRQKRSDSVVSQWNWP